MKTLVKTDFGEFQINENKVTQTVFLEQLPERILKLNSVEVMEEIKKFAGKK